MNDAAKVPSIVGTWYLRAGGSPHTAAIAHNARNYRGKFVNEAGESEILSEISWDPASGVWEFCRTGQDFQQWFHGTVSEGIFTGRCCTTPRDAERPALASYHEHVTGWNSTILDKDIVPRTYDVILNGSARASLRLDRDEQGHLLGQLKVVATRTKAAWDAAGEEAEYDLEVLHWDGEQLRFVRRASGLNETYTGQVQGNRITGTCTRDTQTFAWQGTRAEVLGYGLAPRSIEQRLQWQSRARRQLAHLLMAGNPAPLARACHVLNADLPPLTDPSATLANRDDDPEHWPQDYTRTELFFQYTLPNPYGSGEIVRQSHAWLAIPTAEPARQEGYPAVLAFNGHASPTKGCGAWAMLDPHDEVYWYGEAFARRGFVVLTLDISHRPPEDRSALYSDQLQGSDPWHGNGLHPAIAAPEFPHDSAWEEDGERAWDAMRALDLLLSGQLGPRVDPRRVLATGLSLGGEVATIFGALDPRVSLVISAGFSPDLAVMKYRKNHPCWQWLHADVVEYLNTSDLHALIAPRPLIVETGKTDATFSTFSPPFAADKQVIRKSRAAFGDEQGHLVHYLHDQTAGESGHRYRVGDRRASPGQETRAGITLPTIDAPAPEARWSLDWQCDAQTIIPDLAGKEAPTLFDYIDFFWQD